jgi:hypothetical protein
MDPVTTVIMAALTAGSLSGITEVGKNVISDAYQGFKALIERKFGGESAITQAIAALEKNPESKGRQITLAEEVSSSKVDHDPDILEAANKLIAEIERQPGGRQVIVTVKGSRSVGIGGNVSGSTIITGDDNSTR